MNTQTMAQSPFFYYNPEQSADHRQHGLFSPHPNTVVSTNHLQHFQQPILRQEVMSQQPSRMNERPTSSNSHMYMATPFPLQSNTTPIASPRPMYQKPAMIFTEGRHYAFDMERDGTDGYMYPATPPLSISGSTTNSPPMSSGILPTPTGAVFFAENIEGVKEGCESEVKSEILAGGDWARCGSPPLTPGTFHPNIAHFEFCLYTMQRLEHKNGANMTVFG